MMLRRVVFSLWMVGAVLGMALSAAWGTAMQAQTWQPDAGHRQMEIWPKWRIPDPRPMKGPEKTTVSGKDDLIAGRQSTGVEQVAVPTMTVYSPKGNNTGAAVVVYPGGGFMMLAIDLEGTEACDWLVSRGITCVLLKYRVPAPRSRPYWGAYPESKMALEDAQRTMGLVRLHAKEWGIDPHKVGVLGFSAGGYLVVAMSVHWAQRIYAPLDEADRQSIRPDFAIAMYPGHLSMRKGTLELNPDIKAHITKETSPTFLLQNEDDHVDTVWDAMSYEAALLNAGVPVEFHSYAKGGHAFGLRRTKNATTWWTDLAEVWMGSLGVIPAKR